MHKIFCFLLFVVIYQFSILAQNNPNIYQDEEAALTTSTKQVNQFIRRFNGEEDFTGKRLYPKDKKYRELALRKTYLSNLIDLENATVNQKLKDFTDDICSQAKPKYFDFYGGKWFAEVMTKFLYNGKEQNVILFLKLEEENSGYKWSFINAYAGFLDKEFISSPPTDLKFIHPMSHEIDFMTLTKVFKRNTQVEHFAEKSYSPDYLTLFFYLVKKGNLVFENVEDLKFHVFQIENWYFEMQYFNRKGENTGWLISNLFKIPEKDKASLINSIYHETSAK
jgi:hypothetical protein